VMVALSTAVFGGCSGNTYTNAASPWEITNNETAHHSTGDPVAQFVACLRLAGITAVINDNDQAVSGMVFILDSNPIQTQVQIEGRGDVMATRMSVDFEDADIIKQTNLVIDGFGESHRGIWLALSSSSGLRGEIYDAYASCEYQVPEFAQPSQIVATRIDAALRARQLDNGIQFAQCAREEGFGWVADPDIDGLNGLADRVGVDLEHLSSAEVDSLLTLCWPERSDTHSDPMDFCWSTNGSVICGDAHLDITPTM